MKSGLRGEAVGPWCQREAERSRGLCQHVVDLVSPGRWPSHCAEAESCPLPGPVHTMLQVTFSGDGVSCMSCCSRWQGPAVGQAEFGAIRSGLEAGIYMTH